MWIIGREIGDNGCHIFQEEIFWDDAGYTLSFYQDVSALKVPPLGAPLYVSRATAVYDLEYVKEYCRDIWLEDEYLVQKWKLYWVRNIRLMLGKERYPNAVHLLSDKDLAAFCKLHKYLNIVGDPACMPGG